MAELDEIKKKVRPSNILLVVDAMMGQDAVRTAKTFNERLELSGVVLTKLDGDTRHPIARIDVIRIRPQQRAGEPVAPLIEDPWRSFECAPDPDGCQVEFSDPDFPAARRDTAYYVRAHQVATPAINAATLRTEFDAEGNAISVAPCYGDYRLSTEDDCLAPAQERAWSSPIYVDYDVNDEGDSS